MQNRSGYCSFCCVFYNNLEQHISSDHHRSLITQKRQQMGAASLMERFLQDVLQHRSCDYQESRSMQNERLHMTTVSPSEVVPNDDFSPEIKTEDASGVREEISTKASEPVEKFYSRPQGYIHSVSDRPSVIQKLEKGQQHPLEFIHKVGSSMKEFNPVGLGHSTNNRQSVICSSVISNALVSCLPESSHERPVTADTPTGLSLGVHLDSVNKCDPNKVDKYLKQLDKGSRNPMLPSHPETSSVPYQKPEELNRKSLRINSDKLTLKEDVNSQTKALSTGFKVHEFAGTENSLKLESLSKFAVSPVVNLNKTDMPSSKGVFEDDILKHHEKFFPNMDHNQEGKHLVFNKSAFLEQKISVSSEMQSVGGSLQSASDHCEEAEPDLWKGEQTDQEDKNCESRDSERSFHGTSSFYSLMEDQSQGTAEEINLSKEVHTDLQYKNNTSYISEISSDCDDSLQLTTSRTQVKDGSVQKARHIRLVDESYESSDSEMNFDCDASLQSTDDFPQQPEKEVSLPKGARVGLVDMSYGSSSSEISADSVFSLQSMPGQFPVTITERELRKEVHMSLVDKNYGSSCSETSFDGDISLQSVFDHPHVAVSERNLEDRLVSLKDRNYKPSSAKAYLDCDVSLETGSDGPQEDVENINLQKEKNGFMDMNREFHGPEIKFHLMKTDPQLVPAQSQVAVKEVNAQEVAIDLENKSVKSGISDLSFESHPIGVCGEINMKALNVDTEVKSYGCSSFESTFDSDSSFMSVSKYPELDVEEISKKHVNLEDESFESISSEITFYSDSPLHSVVDQSQVTVYEEDPIDLENKSCESYVSEITFDSDVPLYSGTYQPEVVVKETFIQKEACTHLGEKDDVPGGSEISLTSYIPFHSVINQPEEAVKNLNPQKEEWVHLENKENESSDSEIFDYDIFRSMTGHSKEPIKERTLQKRENIHLENKDNVPIVSENSLKSGITFHLMTGHLSIAIKEINQKEEHVNLTDKNNELKVSEASLDTDSLLQSVTHKPEVIVKELGLQKEKHAKLKGQSAEYSDSEISLDSDYSMTESQITVKEVSVQKEYVVLENKSDKCNSSEIILDSGVPLQSMNEKPQTTVLKEDHVDPEDESTGPRGFGKKLNTSNSLHSVIDQPQLALFKEKHVHLEDTNSESSDGKVDFVSADPLQPLTEQFQEVVEETNVQKEEDMSLKNKVDEPNDYKLIHNSDVSLPSVSNQPKVAVKRINLKNENHVHLKDKNRQDSGFAMSLNSDLMDQSVVDHPQITILEQKHTELEDKHNQSCGSEVSFNSDDPLQSVANRLRQTAKEISPWRDEVDVEDKRDEPKHFEIVSDSDSRFQSVAGQTEVVKKVNLLKEHVDLEDKVVKPSDSKINFVSDEPLQSAVNEVQEAVTEMNLLRERPVCLSAKSCEPIDSEIIFVSNTPLQSVVEPHHDLEEQQANLEDKSNDPCGPKINFVSEYPLQSVTGKHQKKAVKEIGLWEEDHIYLEDKRYKLGDFEVSYDSNVDFVAGHSTVVVKEINLQEEDQNDLENKNCELSVSEIKCDSGVHLQLGVDQPQVVCKEINLQMEKHLGMEEEVSEPRDSEIMCDSDVPLQIVINELEESDRETDKMLFVDLTASDNDCEMISDSDVPFQPAIDSPQRTVKEISCINAESFDLDENCDSCDSELRYVCEASPQSVTNHSKKVFKVVKQKQDYIILEETSCEPSVSELSFQIDSSHQSMTYQSQESEKKKAKYSDPKDKSCQSSGPKRNFEWEETSQPVTQQQQQVEKGVNPWKDVENIGLKDKNCESGVSAMDFNASPGLVIHQMPDQENLLKLKHTDLGSMICEPCGSGVNFQCDPSLQSGNDRPQEAVNKINLFKKMSFDQRETNHNNSHSDSVPMVDSIRNLEKAKEVIEDDLHELLPEDLPPVPPSFAGKTRSQIMKEDEVQMSALVKEFKEGHLYCYFVSDCEMRKIKKNFLNEEKKMTCTDLNQDTTSIQVLSDCDDNVGGISDIDDFSVALDKPNHYPSTERNHEQTWREASQGQAIKVSHGTQTNLTSHPGTKRRISGQEKDSPVRKHLLLQNDRKTREEVKKNEFPESGISVLKPLQANTLIYILSSNIKLKKGESNSFSKRKHCSRNNWNINIQYKFNQSSFNCYNPLNKQIVIDPSLNIEVPGSDRNNCVEMHVSHLNSNAEDNDPYVQSSASVPFVTVSVGHELKSQEASESSVFPEKSKIFSSSEISKESNFQSTFSSRDVAKTSSKSFRKKFLKSKSKNQRRKVTANNKPDFPKKGCRSVIPQQNTRIASEKRSIWIQSKLSDIIKKYIPKYSVFLRHKYQCRSTFVRMHIKKKKPDVSRLKKAKKPANILSNSSVLLAGAEEQSQAIASSSPKQPVQTSSSVARRKKNGNKKHPRRQQRKPHRPIRTYHLRSLFSGVPYSDRIKTRFSNKL
ncbi:DBF4-type zinc finger-containing protein 2 [Odocoileus virginianus]|uniref:DBF4-type zinc finger-containing protein 2 n=1 Tax=Odocoileus virginianus TaxID=9874 RepID=A0A6J0XGN1_ODOVR